MISPGDTQSISYRNGFIIAQCRSLDCVWVRFASGFSISMKAATWESLEFLEHPGQARRLQGAEHDHAVTFVQSQSSSPTSSLSAPNRCRPGP